MRMLAFVAIFLLTSCASNPVPVRPAEYEVPDALVVCIRAPESLECVVKVGDDVRKVSVPDPPAPNAVFEPGVPEDAGT